MLDGRARKTGCSMAERVKVGARGVGRTSVQHFSKSNAACRVALLGPKSCCQNSSKISLGKARSFPYTIFSHADMAQLVEHHLAKVGVAGSSPVVRSMNLRAPVRRGFFVTYQVCAPREPWGGHGSPGPICYLSSTFRAPARLVICMCAQARL